MINETVRRLTEARHTRCPIPVADACPADATEAYAVQDAVARACNWFGNAPARHWKSGGPSRDAVLTHAPLPPEGVWTSPATAGAWPFNHRGIEAEIALRLDHDIDPALARTLDETRASELIGAMCVSIEIVDSRWEEGLNAPALAKLADLQSHGALVLGTWVPFARQDWHTQTCRAHIGGQPHVERQGTHPLADPAFVLPAWLRHVTRDGQTVPAGTVVTTGTWVGILPAARGDLVIAEFPGIGRTAVQL